MLVACWSAKGGSGTTVVAAALALSFARTAGGAVLADLAGDAPCVLGMHEPDGPGLTEWLGAGPSVPADALSRIEVEAVPGLWLLPRGGESADATARADVLASLLLGDARTVVADCGLGPVGAARAVAAAASVSLLVVRPCYVALRRRARRPAASVGCRARERTRARTRGERRRRRARCAGPRRGHGRGSRRSGGRCRLAHKPLAALTRTCTAEGGMTLADDVEARVHHQLLEDARAGATAPSRATIVELVRREAPLLGAGELDTIVRHVSARTAGLGPLEALLGDPSITEVMVNACCGRLDRARRQAVSHRSRTRRCDRRPPDRAGGGATGVASRSVQSPRRRPAPRRVTSERGGAAGGDRRSVPHDPPLRCSHRSSSKTSARPTSLISCIRRSRSVATSSSPAARAAARPRC